MTIDVPDALAAELKDVQDQMGRIIELGLERFRDVDQDASRFASMSEVVDVLAQLPEPEEILALRPSKALQERISALIEKSRSTGYPRKNKRNGIATNDSNTSSESRKQEPPRSSPAAPKPDGNELEPSSRSSGPPPLDARASAGVLRVLPTA